MASQSFGAAVIRTFLDKVDALNEEFDILQTRRWRVVSDFFDSVAIAVESRLEELDKINGEEENGESFAPDKQLNKTRRASSEVGGKPSIVLQKEGEKTDGLAHSDAEREPDTPERVAPEENVKILKLKEARKRLDMVLSRLELMQRKYGYSI